MRIKSVYIEGLHNAHDKTYTFEDITYLHGRNGAGKSTVLNAIQFALLGYIPGSKTKTAKLRHSKDGKIHVKITLLDDSNNDIVIDRVLTENTDILTTTPENYDITTIISDLELPIFNFNEFIGQTANKLKDYFIKNILPIQNGTINWESMLTNAIADKTLDNKEDIIRNGVELVSDLNGSPLEQAVSANEIFKNEVSAIKKELDSMQGAIDSLIFYDDYTGPANIDAIDDQIRELSLLKDSVIAYRTAEMQVASVQSKLEIAQKELADLTTIGNSETFNQEATNSSECCEDITNKMQSIKDEIHEIDAKIKSRKFIINSKGVCQYTGDVCESIAAKAEVFTSQVKEFSDLQDALKDKLSEYQLEYNRKHSQFEEAQNNINKWNTLTLQIDNLQSMVNTLPTKPNTDKTDIELAQEIQALQNNKMKAFANHQYNATIDDLTKKKFQTELELAVYKAWVKKTDVNDLQTQIMQQPFNELADKMTSYIQTMYGNNSLKAHFNVEAKANSFSLGIIRDDKYIPYDLLSSGEKCLYTLALMICIIDNSKSPLKVLLLDDSLDNLDDVAIENTFEALKNISGIQFIMAGVKNCNSAQDILVTIAV